MFQRHTRFLGGLAAATCTIAVLVAAAGAQQPPVSTDSGDSGGILVKNCMVGFVNKTKVPAQAQGKLLELNIEEGMTVKKGDVLAVIDAEQAGLALELKKAEELVAKIAAQNDINLRDAVATEEIASAEAKTLEELHERGAAPYWEMRKKQAEAERAKLRIELAQMNEKSAMAEFRVKEFASRLANYEIEMRTVRADFDAFVENRFSQLGEWVQPGTPIVELVQMDKVRVEGFVDAISYAGQVRKGTPVAIEITVGGTLADPVKKQLTGTIDYVSTEVDLNGRHRIWAEIKNERIGEDWLIKPGMTATMEILPIR
ncbi:MAG: HlyD family efflux transporter periplasmic adaptor subunit [Planctomycetota bacterium]